MNLRRRLAHFLSPAAYQDDRFRTSYFMKIILWIILVMVSVSTLYFFFFDLTPTVVLTNLFLIGVVGLSFFVLSKGQTAISSYLLIFLGWGYITLSLFLLGGLSNPNVYFYLLLLILGGYLLGVRGLVYSAALAILGLTITFFAHNGGLVVTDPGVDNPAILFGVLTGATIFGSVLVYISTVSLQGAVRHADQMLMERQQYAASLAESQEKFRAVIEQSPMGMFLMRLDSDQRLILVDCNPAVYQILGVDIRGQIGEHLENVFPGIHQSGMDAAFKEVIRTGKSLYLEGIPYNDEKIQGNFEIHAFRTSPDSMAVMFLEISERIKTEKALKESENALRAFINSLSEPAMMIDTAGNIQVWNQSVEETFGLAPEQVTKTNALVLFDPNRYDQRKAILSEIVRSKAPVSFEEKSDGRLILINVYPVLGSDGRVERMAVISFDITEREKTERRLMEQITRMAALRSIDTAINSSLDLRATLNVFLTHVLQELKADGALVLLFNPITHLLDFGAVNGFRSSKFRVYHLRLGEGPAGQAALQRKTVIEPDLRTTVSPFAYLSLLREEHIQTCISAPLISKGELKGVLEIYFRAPFNAQSDWLEFLETLSGQAAIAIDNMSLFDNLQRSHRELAIAYDATLQGWMHALDLRDHETEGHTQRVTSLLVKMAHKLGIAEEKIVHMRRGAILHDIGKIGIPDQILLKPGPLTPEEWEEMKKHASYSRDLLLSIPYLVPAIDIPYCHHEKWDGSGYPRGLKGEAIPISARIFALIDVWDALTNDRPYHPAIDHATAKRYIQDQAGKHFDPRLVDEFLGLIHQESENPQLDEDS